MQANKINPQEPSSWLLQLPEAALGLVLQQLDQCSRACVAVTCSTLRGAVPAATSKVERKCSTHETFDGLNQWLEQHNNTLTSLTDLSILASELFTLYTLPCRQLRRLQLTGCGVQLGPSQGRSDVLDGPGVLADCTSLTSLELSSISIRPCSGTDSALAAIEALPGLERLQLTERECGPGHSIAAHLQLPSQLTYLSLGCDSSSSQDLFVSFAVPQFADRLSALVNLRHLTLQPFPEAVVLGECISQLVQLTSLIVQFKKCAPFFGWFGSEMSGQLQGLRNLTALQHLSFTDDCLAGDDGDWSAIPQFPQLTRLELSSYAVDFSATSPNAWTRVTAIQSLALSYCQVQPALLAAFTQLRALSLEWIAVDELGASVSLRDLLPAVSGMSLLTELRVRSPVSRGLANQPGYCQDVPASAFTALTVSTKLCSLELCFCTPYTVFQCWELFKAGVRYPHLQKIKLASRAESHGPRFGDVANAPLLLSKQQLQQLCRCCPAVQSLQFALCGSVSRASLWPLLQLSALTQLEVCSVRGTCAVAAVVDTVVQLTGLKQLILNGPEVHWVSHKTLKPLTALVSLEVLLLHNTSCHAEPLHINVVKLLRSKARWNEPPDVAQQLQRACQDSASCPTGAMLHQAFAAPGYPPAAGGYGPFGFGPPLPPLAPMGMGVGPAPPLGGAFPAPGAGNAPGPGYVAGGFVHVGLGPPFPPLASMGIGPAPPPGGAFPAIGAGNAPGAGYAAALGVAPPAPFLGNGFHAAPWHGLPMHPPPGLGFPPAHPAFGDPEADLDIETDTDSD